MANPEIKSVLEAALETVKPTGIHGLCVVDRPSYPDERGLFREVCRLNDLEVVSGVPFHPCQMNHSVSQHGVLRGLHAEPWNKLVYPVTGVMFAAIVDIKPESPTFGRVEEFTFDTQKGFKALFIPEGCANSICVVGDQDVNYLYLVDKYWNKETRSIAWDDPDLKINWPVKNPNLSDKDKENPTLRKLFPEKFYSNR